MQRVPHWLDYKRWRHCERQELSVFSGSRVFFMLHLLYGMPFTVARARASTAESFPKISNLKESIKQSVAES